MTTEDRRIIHVPRRFAPAEWGGTETVLLNLCRQQVDAGWQPEIHTSMALNAIAEETWSGIPIRRYQHVYPFFGLDAEEKRALDLKGGNLISFPFYFKLRRARQVRLYHAHAINRLGGETLTLARGQEKPCVVSVHGNVFDMPKAEAEALARVQKRHFEWGKPLGMLFRSRRLLREADAVMCVGHSEYEAAREALRHDRVYHLPNGVRPEAFASGDGARVRRELDIPEDAIVFGCVGRIDRQKGQHVLIDAFARLAEREPKMHLILAGPVTEPDYAQGIRTRVPGALQQRIHLLPAVEPESDAHRNLLHSLDTFVLPSRHEPFGIVVLEAWSAGLPVIASRVGGLIHLVEHERDGLHVESGSVDSLSDAMVRLMREPDIRRSLAEAGRQKARSRYSWSEIGRRLEEIYCRAEARNRG